MLLTRRAALLSASSLIPAVLLLADCGATTLSQLASDASAAVAAAEDVVNNLTAGGVTVPITVSGYLSTIGASATAIANATAGSTASLASQLVSAGEKVLPILATAAALVPGAGTAISLGLGALQVLLTTIASEAGVTSVAGAAPVSPDTAAAMANIPAVSIIQARSLYAPSLTK